MQSMEHGVPGDGATKSDGVVVQAGVTGSLLCVSYAMYVCLTWWTGAIPSEHFSLQKRPNYAAYQKAVNMFFPGPSRSAVLQ
jgi:steroid 5-alpha reductase family enzyme